MSASKLALVCPAINAGVTPIQYKQFSHLLYTTLTVSHIKRSHRWSKYFFCAVNNCVKTDANKESVLSHFFAGTTLSAAVQWQLKMHAVQFIAFLLLFPGYFLNIRLHWSPCPDISFELEVVGCFGLFPTSSQSVQRPKFCFRLFHG